MCENALVISVRMKGDKKRRMHGEYTNIELYGGLNGSVVELHHDKGVTCLTNELVEEITIRHKVKRKMGV